MILVTNQETNLLTLINLDNIVIIEDVGAYRKILFRTHHGGTLTIYVKEQMGELHLKVIR
jgi:hypothetical protein